MTLTSCRAIAAVAAMVAITAAAPARAQSLEALWYSTGSTNSTQHFIDHADQISAVSPQVFMLDRNGKITGSVNTRLMATAREKGVKVVPLVMNPGFNQELFHHILVTPAARLAAIRNMTALCRDQHFAGIQFDIENVHVSDKAAFTSFSKETADSLHRVGCTLSAAVVPRISDDPGPTSYHKWIFDNWRGVYDYKALADVMDFISLMTYAQHTGGSTAGPVAGYPWVKDCLDFTIKLGVPPEKISLGLAGYSDYWYPVYDTAQTKAGNVTRPAGSRMRGRDLSYLEAMQILGRKSITPQWDEAQKALHAEWSNAGVFESMWVEDGRAFMAKLELVKEYKLRGYSVWVLGLEDPKTWELLRESK